MLKQVIFSIVLSASIFLFFFVASYTEDMLGMICMAAIIIVSFVVRVSHWCGTTVDIFKFIGGLFTNEDTSENKEGEN